MIKVIIKLTAVVSISACASSSNVDYSDKYSGQCYSLLNPSVLYRGWCANISTSISTPKTCLGVQSLPIKAYDKEQSVLKSFDHYQNNKEFWNKKLFSSSLTSSNYELIDKLTIDTRLKITKVIQKQWGTDGYYWAVRAKILSGQHQGKEVTLPTYKFHLGAAWSKRASSGSFSLDNNYVKSCENTVQESQKIDK